MQTNATALKSGVSSSKWLVQSLPYLLIAGLFIQLIAHIHYYAQNVPFWDEWLLHVDIARAASTGTLTLSDLFTQHEAHRTAFTFALVALNTWLFHWDVRIDIYVSALLELMTFAIVAAQWRRIRGSSLGLIAIAALMFSPRLDWEWSFNNHIHFTIFFVLATYFACASPSRRAFLAAMITAVCATYSSGYGPTAWPLGLAALFLTSASRKRLLVWTLFAGFMGLLYLGTFQFSEPMHFSITQIVPFTAAYIGNPFALDKGLFVPFALAIGTLGIAALVVNALPLRSQQAARLWIMLAVYALGMGAFVAIGRAQMGLIAALTGRYGVMANIFWIALVVLIQLNTRGHHLRRLNLAVVSILIGLFVWTSQYNYLPTGDDRYTCALYWPAPCQYPIFPDPVYLTQRIELLKSLHLSLFH